MASDHVRRRLPDLIGDPLHIVRLFLLLALPLGMFSAAVVPLGQVVDEHMHAIRADSLLYGEIIGHRHAAPGSDGKPVQQAGVDANAALVAVVTTPIRPGDSHAVPLTPAQQQRALDQGWSRQTQFVDLYTLAEYLPVFYVPGAIAIGATRLLGGTPYQAFIAIRLLDLACYLVLGALALRIARFGRGLLLCTLLLPMALNLAASANQDGLLIATTALAAALLSAAMADSPLRGGVTGQRSYWLAALLLIAICGAKPPYLPLTGMLLLPFPARGERLPPAREILCRFGAVALVAVPVFAWSWLVLRHTSVPRALPPYEAGPLWPGSRPAVFTGTDMAAQMRVLLADKLLFITLPLNELLYRGGSVFDQMIGVLGWLNLHLSGWVYTLWMAGLLAACGADLLSGPPTRSRWELPFLLFAALLALLAVYVSQYLSWIPVGMPFAGAQGRYFLPLLPPLGLALAGALGGRWRAPANLLLLLPLCAAAVDLFEVPRALIRFYYLG